MLYAHDYLLLNIKLDNFLFCKNQYAFSNKNNVKQPACNQFY